jgi:predicted nucleotidyltransferase
VTRASRPGPVATKTSCPCLAIATGRYVNGTPAQESDVGVRIDFEPSATTGFFALSDIQDALEAALGRPVDLLTPQAIGNYFGDKVLAQAEYVCTKG